MDALSFSELAATEPGPFELGDDRTPFRRIRTVSTTFCQFGRSVHGVALRLWAQQWLRIKHVLDEFAITRTQPIASFCVVGGLALGNILSFIVRAIVCECNTFEQKSRDLRLGRLIH
jgi:hypothetical protein